MWWWLSLLRLLLLLLLFLLFYIHVSLIQLCLAAHCLVVKIHCLGNQNSKLLKYGHLYSWYTVVEENTLHQFEINFFCFCSVHFQLFYSLITVCDMWQEKMCGICLRVWQIPICMCINLLHWTFPLLSNLLFLSHSIRHVLFLARKILQKKGGSVKIFFPVKFTELFTYTGLINWWK